MTLDVQAILKQTHSLRPFPITALRLAEVLEQEHSSMTDIAQAIQYDQALTAEMLKLCNSAFFGFSDNVTTVPDAIIRLGTHKVFQIAMAASSRELLHREIQGYDMPLGYLWRQSIGNAISSSHVARMCESPMAGTAFSSGLLIDIGKIVLNQHVGEHMQEIQTRMREENLAFDEAERLVLGIDHAEMGARLAEIWNFPNPMIECIRFHHAPDQYPGHMPELVRFIHLGNLIALNIGFGLGADGTRYVACRNVAKEHNLDAAQLEALTATIFREYNEIRNLFELSE